MSTICGVKNPKSILRKQETPAAEPVRETKTETKKTTMAKTTKK